MNVANIPNIDVLKMLINTIVQMLPTESDPKYKYRLAFILANLCEVNRNHSVFSFIQNNNKNLIEIPIFKLN
jgi:hypothetical protein